MYLLGVCIAMVFVHGKEDLRVQVDEVNVLYNYGYCVQKLMTE